MDELNMNASRNNPQPETEERRRLNFLERVIGIVFSPGKVMEDLASKPRILFPFIIVGISQLLLFLLRYDLYEGFMRKSAELGIEMSRKQGVIMTPDQVDTQVMISSISGLVATPIGTIVAWIVGTAIFLGVFKAFKGEGTYKQFLSVSGYAYIVQVLYLVVVAIVSYFTGTLYQEVALTSVAGFLPESMKGSFFFGFLSGIDLFKIWEYAVIAIGLVYVTKLDKKKVYYIVSGIYVASLTIAGVMLAVGTMISNIFMPK